MATESGASIAAANPLSELDVGCGNGERDGQMAPTNCATPLLSVGGQPLPPNPDCSAGQSPATNGQFETGAFYYIDHEQLLPKSPIQLKEIRVVQVSERTTLDVTVSFPSKCSLRKYFSGENLTTSAEKDIKVKVQHPELDERFVMSSNHAGRILRCRVPSSEIEEKMHQDRFWLVSPKDYDSAAVEEKAREEEEEEPTLGFCLNVLKSCPALCWGVRRKVKYIGKPKEVEPLRGAANKMVMEKNDDSGIKRPRESGGRKIKGKKKKKINEDNEWSRDERKKLKQDSDRSGKERKNYKQLKERWSFERYESAEQKLFKIMKEKGAVPGNPILRRVLREEARKHIGDTGLLDHLLKHMAGRVISNGTERFRRRHNPEGTMEYWVEPAELAELRRKAGVQDPFWIPSPGWKLGDPILPCGMACQKETNHLKEEIAGLRREIECSLKRQEKEAMEVPSQTDSPSGASQEQYESLLSCKKKLEEQIAAIFDALEGFKEEMRVLKEENAANKKELVAKKDKKRKAARESEKEEKKRLAEACEGAGGGVEIKRAKKNDDDDDKINSTTSACASNCTDNNSSRTITSTTTVRRSGFRLCKPQGTFLWPSMGARAVAVGMASGSGSCSRGVLSPPQGVVPSAEDQQEHHLVFGVPTPPSASSAVSAPKLLVLPSPTSPVATRADVLVLSSQSQAKPSQQQQKQQQIVMYETTGSSGNGLIQPHVPRVAPAPSVPFGGGKKEGWSKVGEGGGGGCCGVSTDLALASSSYSR